jgi:hypothetical protein
MYVLQATYVKSKIVARSRYHSWGGNATIRSICIIYDIHIAINNTKLSSVVTKTQQWFPSAPLAYKILRAVVNNINVLWPVLCSDFNQN